MDSGQFLAGVCVGALAALFALIFGFNVFSASVIVGHNCAHYDSKTGDFTWNDEVKK